MIALRKIEKDKSLKLTENQKREVKNKLKNYEQREYEELRKYYRKIFLPSRDGFKEIDMGLPIYGESSLRDEIYNFLNNRGDILKKITPEFLKKKYLQDRDYIEIEKLYNAFLKTPGEIHLESIEVLKNGIKEGVEEGLFGFGYIESEKLVNTKIKKAVNVELNEKEVIVNPKLCKEEQPIKEPNDGQNGDKNDVKNGGKNSGKKNGSLKIRKELKLNIKVPVGKISSIARIANYLKTKFSKCDVNIIIHTSGGEINESEYENKILESFKQEGIDFIEMED